MSAYKFIKNSFTLIEMLIVIVIIGILAAALVPRLTAIQGRARDSKRKTDLRTIYNANEIHFTDNGFYATTVNDAFPTWYGGAWCPYCYVGSNDGVSMRISGFAGILTSVPVDPINIGSNPRSTGDFMYLYGNVVGGTTYDLTAQLENKNDPDRCGVKQYRFWPNGFYASCGPPYGGTPQLYEYSPHSNSF